MNYNTEVTASSALVGTKEEFNILKIRLEEEQEEAHGFTIEFWGEVDEIYLFAEENGDWNNLPKGFLEDFGQLIARNELKYLEFGAAFTASKMAPGSRGGTSFRIHTDGSIGEPSLVWDCEE